MSQPHFVPLAPLPAPAPQQPYAMSVPTTVAAVHIAPTIDAVTANLSSSGIHPQKVVGSPIAFVPLPVAAPAPAPVVAPAVPAVAVATAPNAAMLPAPPMVNGPVVFATPIEPIADDLAKTLAATATESVVQTARNFLSRGKATNCLSLLQFLEQRERPSVEVLCMKAQCLRLLNDIGGCIQCYMEVLRLNSSHCDALLGLGNVFKDQMRWDVAMPYFMKAYSTDNNNAVAREQFAIALTNWGAGLKSCGKQHEAIQRYEEATQVLPTYSQAFYDLGVLYSEINDFERARLNYHRALALNPNYCEVLCNLGVLAKNQGQLQKAIEFYERCIQINPNFDIVRTNMAIALTELGTLVKNQGNAQLGAQYYERALLYFPRYADAYYNLGVTYGELRVFEKALYYYQMALTFNPECAEAHNNLGVIFKDMDNLPKAYEHYLQALKINPQFVQTLNNIGVLYTVEGKLDEGMHYLQRAITVCPTYGEAYNNLGVLVRDEGRVHEAVDLYEKCLKVAPLSNNAAQNKLLALNYPEDFDADGTYEEHMKWGKEFCMRHETLFTKFEVAKARREIQNKEYLSPTRTLRIGYISPDFFTHSVSYFIDAPLRYHKSSKNVEVFLYSNVAKGDAKTMYFKSLVDADHWRDTHSMSTEALSDLIMADGIDILVELTGHTANNRLDVMACKPAPLQVTWIGYPNTTGLPTIDYRFTDAVVDPIGMRQKYVEKLVRLPSDSFLCYSPNPEAPPVSPSPSESSVFITFGTFNNVAKMNPKVYGLWARILQQLPNARLILKSKPFACARVRKVVHTEFERFGVSESRVDLMALIPTCRDHLSAYSMLDISLDTFPYAGTTTTCEALFMGVPVIVLKGSCHAHNVGVSLLTSIGLTELIADSEDDYIRIAVELGKNPSRVHALRRTMRERMLKSRLCNADVCGEAVEDTYRSIWSSYCALKSGDRSAVVEVSDTDSRYEIDEENANTSPTSDSSDTDSEEDVEDCPSDDCAGADATPDAAAGPGIEDGNAK